MYTDKDGEQTMTAHELARALLKMPDLPVQTEGCDCYGLAADLEVDETFGFYRIPHVLIQREKKK